MVIGSFGIFDAGLWTYLYGSEIARRRLPGLERHVHDCTKLERRAAILRYVFGENEKLWSWVDVHGCHEEAWEFIQGEPPYLIP